MKTKTPPTMVGDTGERPNRAILLSARHLPTGAIRVCVDRVSRVDSEGGWNLEHPVTFRDLLEGVDEVSDEDLISLAVVLLTEATRRAG